MTPTSHSDRVSSPIPKTLGEHATAIESKFPRVSKARVFRNVLYSVLIKGTTLVCIALTSSVIARNLAPSDYGVIGFATIIIGFLSRFSDLGTDSAAIRQDKLDQIGLRTAFSVKIALNSIALVIAFLLAPFANHIFNHPATTNVIRVLALDFLLSTIGTMSYITVMREHNYKALVLPGIASAIVRCIVAITLVLLGWKYWAVILANLCASLTWGIAIHLARKIPIAFRLDRIIATEYLRFGVPLLGSGVLAFLVMNLDNFLVGARMGSTRLGYYALAFTWGSFICGILYDTVNYVLFPAFSAIQNDPQAMRRWYLKTVDLIGFIAVIVNTALLANSNFFLTTFLGKGTGKWLPAAAALKILCVYGILKAVIDPVRNCAMAKGQTSVLLRANGLTAGVETMLLILALRKGGIEQVAAAVIVAYAFQAVIYVPYLRRTLGIGLGDIVLRLWPLVPALVGGYFATSLLPVSLGTTFVTLAVRGLFTALVASLIHGLCTSFRCFAEAGSMVARTFAQTEPVTG